MHRLNPRPFFPGLLPKSRLRSCSSHTCPSCTFSLALGTWLLGVCFLFFFFIHLHPLERLWLLHSLCIQLFHHTPPSSIGFYKRAASPHSSFNNSKVSDVQRHERLRDPSTSMTALHRPCINNRTIRNTAETRMPSSITCSRWPTPIFAEPRKSRCKPQLTHPSVIHDPLITRCLSSTSRP
jgi:hypothetical protein